MKIIGDKKYLILSVFVVGTLLMIAALFNDIIDPYNLMGNNPNGVYFVQERQVKDAVLTYLMRDFFLERAKPDTSIPTTSPAIDFIMLPCAAWSRKNILFQEIPP